MSAGARVGGDRLWPVLATLTVLLGGAAALEGLARERSAHPVVIVVNAAHAPQVGDDDGSEGEDTGTLEDTPPLDADHASARQLARRGDVGAALDLFAKVAQAHPDAAAVFSEQGFWLLAARKTDLAKVALTRATELAPRDARAALNLGVATARLGDDEAAMLLYRRALELRPGYAGARLALGTALRRRGALDEAIAIFRQASESGGNEQRAQALVALGRTLLKARRRDEAGRALDEAINRAPAQIEIRVSAARAWLEGDKREDAARALDLAARAAELGPDLAAVHSVMGRVQERLGDDAAAEVAYERAVRLDPGMTYARRRLLRLALERRDFARARGQAVRLLQDAPEEAEHHFLAGLVAAREGQRDEARKHYESAIKANPRYEEAWFNLGLLEKADGKTDAAIAAYKQAIAIRPDYLAAFNNLALTYAGADRDAEAEATYRKVLAVDPSYATAWNNLGKLLKSQRPPRHDEAIAAFQKADATRPGGYPEARLSLASTYSDAGKLDLAIATYRALTTAQPRYATAWHNLGVVLARKGQVDEASAAFSAALALDEERANSRRGLAELEAAKGNLPAARDHYLEALEREPDHGESRVALASVLARLGDSEGCSRHASTVKAGSKQRERALELVAQCSRKN